MVWQQNIHGYSKVNIVSGIQPKTSAGESSVKLAPAPQSPASTQTQQMAQLTGAPVSPLHPYIFPAATTFSYLAALISADDFDLPLALGGASLGLAGVTAYTRRTNILGYTNLTEAQYNKYTQALGPITDLALRGVLAMTATNVAFRALDAAGVSYNSLMTGALVATSAALLTIPRTRQTLVKSRGVAASTVGATWSVAKNITTRIVQTAAKNSLVIYGGIAAAAAWWGYHNADHVYNTLSFLPQDFGRAGAAVVTGIAAFVGAKEITPIVKHPWVSTVLALGVVTGISYYTTGRSHIAQATREQGVALDHYVGDKIGGVATSPTQTTTPTVGSVDVDAPLPEYHQGDQVEIVAAVGLHHNGNGILRLVPGDKAFVLEEDGMRVKLQAFRGDVKGEGFVLKPAVKLVQPTKPAAPSPSIVRISPHN